MTRAATLAGAATFAMAVATAGQTVLGTVLERGGGGSVAGAMVRLVDDRGGTRSGWITREDGRFRLETVPGTYDLVIERIGFDRKVVQGLDLVEEGITSIHVAVDMAAIRLEGLTVEGTGRGCPRIDEGEATQVIWEEARKALTAAAWTERQSRLRFNVLRWDRFIDAETDDVIREDWSDQQWVGTNSVTSLPPEDLEAGGYVRRADGDDHYYGPDAQTLLSPSFLDSHCFRVVRPAEPDSPLIGLEFEPVQGRELPDIRGTIWVDETDARLEKVEFRYTGVRGRVGSSIADGEVRFAEVTGGRWFVRDWFIRVPQMERRGSARDPFLREVGRVHEVGSRVEQVRGEGIEWTSRLARGSILGAIFDSVSGQPLSRAEVRIVGWPTVVADALGRFEIERLPPGEYRVSFTHPRIDSLGVVPGWTAVTVTPGSATELPLTVPSWETLVERQCGDVGSIVGSVRDERGRPVPGASVTVADGGGSGEAPPQARTDRMGVYGLCGVGNASGVRLIARMGAATATHDVALTDSADHVREDFVLVTPATEFRASPLAGTVQPGLIGTVFRAGTRTPLEGVTVELVDPAGRSVGRSLSGADGAFRIRLNEGGKLQVKVERLGYASGVIGEPLDLVNGARRVEILLPESPIELEPVLVVIDARVDRLESTGFYARAMTRPGVFLIRDDVEVLDPARTSDLLGRAPGVRLTSSRLGDFRRRVVFRSLALTEGEGCYPSLFVDGELVQMGGVRMGSATERFALDDEEIKSVDEFVRPSEIEALELYGNPAVIPQRFVGLSSRCGAIVIWTRRPD